MVYISVIYTQTLQITLLHDIDLLWGAFHVLHWKYNYEIYTKIAQLMDLCETFVDFEAE